MINIKVSGITTLKQLQQLEGLNIPFADLDFIAGSTDFAGEKLDAESLEGLDLDIKKTGLFSNANYEEIMAIAEKYELDIVQLDGAESPELCADLSEDLEVIKTFRIGLNTGPVDEKIKAYDDACDYYLFDSVAHGKKFDWRTIAESKIEKPFFLAGGIGPEDAALIKKFKHPDFYGVNTGSLFQKEPGIVDMALLLKFIQGFKK